MSAKTQGAFHSVTPAQLQKASSLATSVKAEPGSNLAPSDSSKKCISDSPQSLAEGDYSADQLPSHPNNPKHQSYCAHPQHAGNRVDTTCPHFYISTQKYTDSNGNSDDMDGSSFSSFYSSFIKTTDGSDSPPDNEKETKHRKKKITQVSVCTD